MLDLNGIKDLVAKYRHFLQPAPGVEVSSYRSPAALIRQAAQDPALAQMLDGYFQDMPLSIWSNPIRGGRRLRGRWDRFQHETQRPTFYFPHLKAMPWWPRDEIAASLEAGFETFCDEFYAAEHRIAEHPSIRLADSGDWRSTLLYRDNRRLDENCAAFPRTLEILEKLPICPYATGQVYFSVLAPGTHVRGHCGTTNTRRRYHLGIETHPDALMTVGGEARPWASGKCTVFDDSFKHEVHNNASCRRIILLVDCWHPDLSESERKFVAELVRQLDFPTSVRA